MRSSPLVAAAAVTLACAALAACTDPEPDPEPTTPEGYEPCAPQVDAPMGEYSLRRTGMPQFCPVDSAVSSMKVGPPPVIGTIRAVAETILPDHEFEAGTGAYVGATAHAAPYAGELLAGLVAADAVIGQQFTSEQASAPRGLVITTMLVPSANAPEGASLDAELGPIMPREIFPIAVNMTLFHEDNGRFVVIDGGNSAIPVPPWQGKSHQPVLNIEQSDTPAPSGRYVVRLTFTEVRGTDAYEVNLPFTIL